MKSIIDLHIHSTASDGTVLPEDILKKAMEEDLKYISLTDHESIEGYKKLIKKKEEWSKEIKIISGVELHTYYNGCEIHLLGYFVDVNNSCFNARLKEIRRERTEIAFDTVKKIQKIKGFNIKWEDVSNLFGGDIAVTKAHIILTLKKLGNNLDKETFYNFFNNRGKYYLPYKRHHLSDAVELIESVGGIPLLAHPGLIGDDTLVENILKKFNIGLEVYYHYFGEKRNTWIEKYKEMAKFYNRIESGGTDYHGSITSVEIGDTYVPYSVIENLLKFKHQKAGKTSFV